MTQDQKDMTVDFIQRYWFIGIVLVSLAGFAFGVGEKMSSMQGAIDSHDLEIKDIVVTQQQEAVALQSIQVQLAQSAQQLADIKYNLGMPAKNSN